MRKDQKSLSFKMSVLSKTEEVNTKGLNTFRIELAGPKYPFNTDDPRYGAPILNGELVLNAPHFMIGNLFIVGGECRFSITPLPGEPTALANSGLTVKKPKRRVTKKKRSVILCTKHPNYKALRPPRTDCVECQKAWKEKNAEGNK